MPRLRLPFGNIVSKIISIPRKFLGGFFRIVGKVLRRVPGFVGLGDTIINFGDKLSGYNTVYDGRGWLNVFCPKGSSTNSAFKNTGSNKRVSGISRPRRDSLIILGDKLMGRVQ